MGLVRKLSTFAQEEEYRRLGVWDRKTLYEYFEAAAKKYPEKEALIDSRRRYTYQEMKMIVDRLSSAFFEMGIGKGDVVAAQLPNWGEIPIVHMAVNQIGGIFMPLSTTWRHTEIGQFLKVSRALAIILPETYEGFNFLTMIEELKPELPHLENVIVIGGSGKKGTIAYEGLIEREGKYKSDYLKMYMADPEDPAHMMVSSGTTGMPKMSIWSSSNIITLLVYQYAKAIKFKDEDIFCGIAPANTGSTGYVFPILTPLLLGATSVILEKWSEPEKGLELIAKEKCTVATAIPTQMIQMMASPVLHKYDYSSLKTFVNAGAPLPYETAKTVEEELDCVVQTLYGATDGGVPVMTTVDDPPEKRRSTVGRVVIGEELRLVDANYNDVQKGEAGEVIWRGANMSYGYFNQPEYDDANWSNDGYFLSGDIGVLDELGYLKIVGRKKDMILRGGTNIFPLEIEDLLMQNPKIREVAVVRMPDPVLGERACAFVATKEGETITFDEMVSFLQGKGIAKWKLPERLEVVDSLPRNPGGKIQKNELEERIASKLKEEGKI